MANVKDLLVNGSARIIGTIYGNATSANNSDKLDGKHLNEIAASKSTTLAWNTSSTVATIGGNNITVTMPANPNTWRGIQNNLTSDSTTDSLSAAQGKALKSLVDGKAASSHTHDDRYYTESEINTKLNAKLNTSLKGTAGGLAELDSNGKVPSTQLPSYVDDVIEGYLYNSKFYKESGHTTVITGETGKIYIDLSNNKTYRWSGSTYVVISETLALGETSSTAYRGDRGKIAYDHSQSTHARTDATKVEASSINGKIKINGSEVTVYTHPSGTNPHGTTKSDVGLGNVGNFKAVSTVAAQGLTDTEKANARANIGAGTSSFSGSYTDLSNKPIIPTVGNGTITITQNGTSKGTFTTNQSGNTTIALTDNNTTYSNATISAAGLMSKDDKAKLDGITASADAVSFSRSLTSGTKVGTITINGTGTDLYAPTNTDTHWTTGLKVGASNTATANAAASNGSVYLNVLDNSTVRDSHKITGSGATSVTSDANGVITISSTNTTYGVATTSANGLMSSTDKSKLDGIAAGANNYSHPTSSGNKHIPAGGSSGQILRWSADGTAVWGADTNTWRGIQNNLTSDSTTDSLAAAQGKALKVLIDGKSSTSHTHNYVKDIDNAADTTFAYSKDGLNYGDYTWLAGWNGYELRAVNKSQFAQASHTHDDRYYTESEINSKINTINSNLGLKFDLLWTNASDSAFGAQTVKLNLSNYDRIFIVGRVYSCTICSVMAFKNNESCLGGTFNGSSVNILSCRKFTFNNNGVTFQNGYSDSEVNQQYSKPYKIYGVR